MELEGIRTKAHNVPGVRKKLPAPFTRDRIDLDGGRRVKRGWKDISIVEVNKGDTVSGFGTVARIAEFINIPTIDENNPEEVPGRPFWRFRLHNIMGDYQDFPGEQRVFAFCPEHTDG